MKLLCHTSYTAHWGSILTKDKLYDVISIEDNETEVVTDYKLYYDALLKAANITEVRKWIDKGYTQETLHEVIPGYLTISEIKKLYTKKLILPFIVVKTDEDNSMKFCIPSKEELLNMGCVLSEGQAHYGKIAFGYSIHMIDEYFNYSDIRRDNKLNNILS